MIRKLVRQMLTAQIFSALTVSLCLMIDNIMIGRYLGVVYMAAYGLANPVLLSGGAIAGLMSAGIQVACSKSLGRGDQRETNAAYSSAIAVSLVISILLTGSILLFSSQLATLMGAGSEGKLFDETQGYLSGFCIGAPASIGALVLVPFLQISGQTSLLIAAVMGMMISDVALDILNVTVFNAGMFGMGLASAISYYVALIIGGIYFFRKKCVFRFSWKLVSRHKIIELFKGGIPTGVNMLSSVILVYVMNMILKGMNPNESVAAIAAFSAFSTIGGASNAITTGAGGVSLTLAGIFYHEEDQRNLSHVISLLVRYSIILGLCVGIILLIFAPALISLFIPDDPAARDFAILGLRLFGAGLIPSCIMGTLKFMYQATGRVTFSEVISFCECAVLPALVALIFSRFFGVTGAWLYFCLGELLTLILMGLYIIHKKGVLPWKNDAFLLLREDFGVLPKNLMEVDIHSVEEASRVAETVGNFCLELGESEKLSNHIALCIEEMATNVTRHGFTQDNRPHHLSIRVLKKKNFWILRFRDDCKAFDPTRYTSGNGEDALGIRLMMQLAEEAKYTYSMNLNNLALKLSSDVRS